MATNFFLLQKFIRLSDQFAVDKDVQTSYLSGMKQATRKRKAPGMVRDAILKTLQNAPEALPISEIHRLVMDELGPVPESSVRSYLLLNTPDKFTRVGRGRYTLTETRGEQGRYSIPAAPVDFVAEASLQWVQPEEAAFSEPFCFGKAELYFGDCFEWLELQPDCSIHAVVTDPPYGIREYTPGELAKLRAGHGGVWRLPPSFDGNRRAPLPRFTVLNRSGLEGLAAFFLRWGRVLFPKLVPGANVVVASNPLLASIVAEALARSGLERRGELVRLTMTMRGGDRPKNAEREFGDVSVMPRSMWEPWLVFRRPLEGRVQDNLRKWWTGGFRRIGEDKPFGDVIKSSPTHKNERALANHPSLKPQAFLRKIVRAVLPLGRGVVVDPFAGAGSTLAAAEAVGYASKGVERDEAYWRMACESIPRLARFRPREESGTEAEVLLNAKRQAAQGDTATLPLAF